MRRAILALAAVAAISTAARGNPYVDSWPWQDTRVVDSNYGNRACVKAVPGGDITSTQNVKDWSVTFALFTCGRFKGYENRASLPTPGCGLQWPAYFCSMQDCRNWQAAKSRITSSPNDNYWEMSACAQQDEPDGVWHFDDSPND
jgi:hypothetical protein